METDIGEGQWDNRPRRLWAVRAGMLVSGLAIPPAGTLPPVRRRLRRLAALAFAPISLLALVASVWLMVQTYLLGWQTGDWQHALSATFVYAGSLFLVGAARTLLLKTRRISRRLLRPRPILDAITTGDPDLTTLAAPQPIPLPPDPLPAGRIAFLSLRLNDAPAQAEVGRSTSGTNNAQLYLFVLPFFVGFGLLRALGVEDTRVFGVELILLTMAVTLALWLAYALYSLYRALPPAWRARPRLLRPLTRRMRDATPLFAADADGFLWRPQGAARPERRISWAAARSFFKAAPPGADADDVRPVTYFLDVGDGVLSWRLTRASAREALVESELLARLVVTHTSLPLRDLAPMFAQLDPARPGFTARETARLFRALRDSAGIASPRVARGCALGCLTMLGLLIVFGGPFLALNRLQAYQTTYLAGLLPRIHAEAPLYQSTLAADDGGWPESPPAAPGTAPSYAFTDAAYRLSGQPEHFV